MAQHQNAALRRQIGSRLREFRERAGITSQEKLADRSGSAFLYSFSA
jgi:transcriptional regulator with XRE-family HTH domain